MASHTLFWKSKNLKKVKNIVSIKAEIKANTVDRYLIAITSNSFLSEISCDIASTSGATVFN